MLKGKEFLEKIEELGGEVTPGVMKACGSFYTNEDNEEIPLAAGFAMAHAEAKQKAIEANNARIDELSDIEVQEELDKEGKSITPYSFRHFYAYLRLINKVPIHLLAKNMGTSVQKIESTYGHINTELHAEVLTKGQGIIKRTETNLATLPTIDDD